MNVTDIRKAFAEFYSEEPLIIRSPGRVNLIGEHTDYNLGFVLPAAVDKEIMFAMGLSPDAHSHLHALDPGEQLDFEPGKVQKSEKRWANYVLGVVDQLQQQGHTIPAFSCVFGGNIPAGAGMSSSAALECGIALGLNTLFNLDVAKVDLVKLSQKAENEFVGMNCGIMDQFSSVFGKSRHALKLDCRSLEYQYYPADIAGHKIVLFNSGVKHELVDSGYNERRSQCEEGVTILQKAGEAVESLRDVNLPMLEKHRDKLPSVVYQRCIYIVKENQRVEEACRALSHHDLATFGKKLYESQHGMQHEYEITVPEIDFLVDQTRNEPAVLGGRMMGGGFGGCTINLIEDSAIDRFSEQLAKAYKEQFSIDLEVYIADIVDGTEIMSNG
uniref:Galactokinase n=1 Tax=Roseihalotalea indica TaxID=2867963 RepID=A0AA49GRE0_9BACT|nr:galactokinase [Tunicatimonas sp. TK19036]